ncbi:hypothetical protein Glove_53g16 [Diversispora epigaea]|uniref:RIIa domain-containing protein n=1 Tax=Diversispora epigaea TaxID=1348612 RepID=A0A397JJR5_9GLOM|nr:hypothetical protein Glove_53g16 [Diversispora epigaea]
MYRAAEYDNTMFTDSSPAETSNNESENRGATSTVRSIQDLLNPVSRSPGKREEGEIDTTGGTPSEDQLSPFKFEEQFGEVVDEERNNIQRLNMRHPQNSTAVRDYFNKTIVPSLLSGMKKMVKERPQNPCEFLGRYLIEHCEHDHNKDDYSSSDVKPKQEDNDNVEPRVRQKQRRDSNSSLEIGTDMDVDTA